MSTSNKSDAADLVIVGAGIAGSAMALACAGRGMNVVVLHRDGDRCGNETVSPATCKYLHKVLREFGIPFSEVVAWWGTDTPSKLAYPGSRVVNRLMLAQQMRVATMNHASIFSIREILNISQSNGNWEISWSSIGGLLETTQARFLCDATGEKVLLQVVWEPGANILMIFAAHP